MLVNVFMNYSFMVSEGKRRSHVNDKAQNQRTTYLSYEAMRKIINNLQAGRNFSLSLDLIKEIFLSQSNVYHSSVPVFKYHLILSFDLHIIAFSKYAS